MDKLEHSLKMAAQRGRIRVMRIILQQHPELINAQGGSDRRTCLHVAVHAGQPEVVRFLLLRLVVDPNLPDSSGETPLLTSMNQGQIECLNILLLDARVDVTVASFIQGYLINGDHVLEIMMVSGRKFPWGQQQKHDHLLKNAPSESKRALWSSYTTNPAQVTHHLRCEWYWYFHRASEVFALIILLQDGYTRVKEDTPESTKRLLRISCLLPLDLQMLLALRICGSCQPVIPSRFMTEAFSVVLQYFRESSTPSEVKGVVEKISSYLTGLLPRFLFNVSQ